MKNLVLKSEANKGSFIFDNGTIYVYLSFIPYDNRNDNIVYFVSGKNGDEFGQFETAKEAIDHANNVIKEIEKKESYIFEVDKTYKMTFIGDSELIVPVKIIKRTAKMVTIKIRNEETKKVKIHIHDDVEFILPDGSYSMAPRCNASREF